LLKTKFRLLIVYAVPDPGYVRPRLRRGGDGDRTWMGREIQSPFGPGFKASVCG
jgi:hypothetical protein